MCHYITCYDTRRRTPDFKNLAMVSSRPLVLDNAKSSAGLMKLRFLLQPHSRNKMPCRCTVKFQGLERVLEVYSQA